MFEGWFRRSPERALRDAVAQLEISRKAIEESKKALRKIFAVQMHDRYTISDLIETLDAMNQQIQDILADIDQGVL